MFPALPAYAAPTGGQVAAGSGVISQAGGNTTVNQTSQNLSLNWQSFNVGAHESVNFVQPNSAAIAVNRIAGASASQILGSLSANGQVFLINPNGIVFGAGAQVNVGGLVASTLNISDSDLTAATRHFTGSGVGTIVNHGTITAAPGGYVVLLGRLVSNQGTISTPGGTAALGAGSAVSLSFDANHLLSMQVDQSTLAALAENKQLIVADGGQVLMSAGAKNSLLASVVNNTGVVQAQTVANHNGRIVLLAGMAAGTTEVGGTLDASSPEGAAGGGFIETSGAVVRVADDARITTHAAHGQTGTWLIDPQDYTIAASGGDITGSTLSTHLGGNNITLMSSAGGTAGSGNINVNDAVSWNANTLTIIAANNININAVMTASGTAGLALNAATTNGADAGVTGGTVNVMPGTGRVDFAGRSGTGFLTINGNGYTVLNSLGVEGDVTGGAATLQGMAASANLAGYYALGSDIDASATNGWNSGAGFDPIGNSTTSFTGVFDGLGHTISGVIINRPALDRVGLFGSTVDPVIRNVGLSSVNITGNDLIGGLVGFKYGGDVSNSYATGQVAGGGDYTGGLVGANMGSVSNSYATASVNGGLGTGGLVGYNIGSIINSYATGQVVGSSFGTGGLVGNNQGSISNSYATGMVHGGDHAVGGLVGASLGTSSISNSYATGQVSGAANDVGGLVGESYATISNSYATGQASGSGINVAGLVGIQYSGSISQSYAIGAVNGPNAGGSTGGLVGRQDGGTVSSSYWNTETTGQNYSTGSADSFGLSSAEMLNASSFAGWDLATTGGSTAAWRIYEGHTAPLLRAFMTDLAVTANNVVSTYTGTAYVGSNAYTYGALTPNFWLPSAGVNTGLFIGNANTSAPAIELGTYALDRGPHSGQLGYDIAFTPGSLTINPVTVPTEIVPTESLPINVKMAIAGLTQDFSQSSSDEPATDHWGFTSPSEADAVDPDLFTIVGSGVRLP
ncbi:filamentous hemagglutinin N-terminal domain-containing protein [Alcaligenaceae bacterium]|nr:filamentous hemagglutinin N-terminal domain-containing protein [Alcaligenaceae bacterium]